MAAIKPLPSDLQKIAEIELGEIPSRIPEDLQALKTWLGTQPHLKARQDDEFLLQYLRGCKYSLEKAKEKLDRLYTMKTKFPELFNVTDVYAKRFREIYHLGFITALPIPLHGNGPRIVVLRVHEDMISGLYGIEEVYQAATALQELILATDPYACINGIIYIFDNRNSSFVLKFTPSFAKKVLLFYEKGLPLRIKAIYYINISSFFQSVYNMVAPLFTPKLRERIVICGNSMDELKNHIPAKYLPKDYGGENGSLQQLNLDYEKVLNEHSNYFKENLNYGTDERLRLGKPLDFDSMFGMGGSFRKLDFD